MAHYGSKDYWKETLAENKFKYDVVKTGVIKLFSENPDNIEQYLKVLNEAKSNVEYAERNLKDTEEE